MSRSAPLRVTVRIELGSGPAAGRRCYRLSDRLELPARLALAGELPLHGEGRGRVGFSLPDGAWIEGHARLEHDPERPELGSRIDLIDISPEQLELLQRYHQERTQP